MDLKEIEKQYKENKVQVLSILEGLVKQFKQDKTSLDIQQLQLVTQYSIWDREYDEDYIDELEDELEKEKNKNKELEKERKQFYEGKLYTAKQLKNIERDRNKYFIHKSKIEELRDIDNIDYLQFKIKELLEERN